ncbi:hypothetical protein IAR55_004510 [Kwoniella newhampshirensis]|uniref:DUF3533 domain-containing protein n=1 Tax=Kwoniella newhampshirensis TaxID=1651941 RepID=A0AAW0YY03_9TREE
MLSASPPPLQLGRPLSMDHHAEFPGDRSDLSSTSYPAHNMITSHEGETYQPETSSADYTSEDNAARPAVVGGPFADIHHHPWHSPSSHPTSATTGIPAPRATQTDQETSRRSDASDETVNPPASLSLQDPSEQRVKEAAAVVGGGAGGAEIGKQTLVSRDHHSGVEGGREPRGWENVQMPSKWGITSKHIKEDRWKAVKKGAALYGFITVWLWICLSIFWGSNYKLTSFIPNLTVDIILLDAPSSTSYLNGPMTQQANYINSLPSSIVHMTWVVKDPSNYPNGLEDVRNSVVAQDCWAAVVVNANASSAWTNALENGDASYDPTGAIGIYYSSARFYQVVLLYIQSIVTEELTNPLSTARARALEAFMASSTTNPTLLTNAARVPQAVGVGFGYSIFDVRPIPNGAWAGAAPMEASLIYFIIFAFYIAQYGHISRMKSGLGPKLRFSSMIKLRLGWPLIAYFFMSLWETLIIRAWQVPLGDHLGRAGFVTLWALNYLTIIAAGFGMETALAVVGFSWLPFFLIMWIIPSSFYPIEMMPTFYRFLRWTPFYHNVEAYKIIAFGTDLQHRLGLHFGALFALIGVELIGLPLAIAFERWTMDRDQKKQMMAKKEEEEREKGRSDEGGA